MMWHMWQVMICMLFLAKTAYGQSKGVWQLWQDLDNWQLEEVQKQTAVLFYEQNNDPCVQLLSAEVFYQLGLHDNAYRLLHDLEGKLSGRAQQRYDEIAARIDGSYAYAPYFQMHATEHFHIFYIDKDTIIAHYAAPVLEAAFQTIAKDLGLLEDGKAQTFLPIAVEIYPDGEGLAAATGLTVKEIETSGTIAVCKYHRLMAISPLATIDGYTWQDTLAHEFAHLVISKVSHNTVPIWLHEGLAKYFESRWRGQRGQAIAPYGLQLLKKAVRDNRYIAFEQMHPSMAKLPSQDDTSLAFAEVFSLIEYLDQTHGVESFAKLLKRLAKGGNVDDALKALYGGDLQNLEKKWKTWLKNKPFPDGPNVSLRKIRLAKGKKTTKNQADTLETMQEKSIHDAARLGELLQLRGHSASAIVEYEKAIKQKGSMRYRSLVYKLASAYANTEQVDKACAFLEEALKGYPEDNDNALLLARLYFKKQQYTLSKHYFLEASNMNPYNPEIHAALQEIYRIENNPSQSIQEAEFLELCRKPRPHHNYHQAPKKIQETPSFSLIVKHWQTALLDGNQLQLPCWHCQITAAQHKLQLSNSQQEKFELTIDLQPGILTPYFLPDKAF